MAKGAYFDDLTFSKNKVEWLKGGIKNEGGKDILIIELSDKLRQHRRNVNGINYVSVIVIKRATYSSDDFFTHFVMINQDEIWPAHQPNASCYTLATPANKSRLFAKMTLTLSEPQLRETVCRVEFDGKSVQCAKLELIISKNKFIGVFNPSRSEFEVEQFIEGKSDVRTTQSKSIF